MKTRSEHERGNISVLVCFAIVMLLSIAALAIDLGICYVAKTELQNAVDAAALAGAGLLDGTNSAVIIGTAGTGGTARAMAQNIGSKNPVGGVQLPPGNFTVAFGRYSSGANDSIIPDTSGIVNAVKVSSGKPSETFFARIFNVFSVDIGAKATAGRTGTGYTVISKEPITSPGDPAKYSGFTDGLVYSDAGEAVVSQYSKSYPTTFPVASSGELKDSVTLSNLTYRFSSITLSGSDEVTISNNGEVVLYVDGDFNFNSKIPINMSAVKSLTMYVNGNIKASGNSFISTNSVAQVLNIYGTGASGKKVECDFSGSSSITVNLYAPNYTITNTGTADLYGMIVGKIVELKGNSFIHKTAFNGPLQVKLVD